MTAHSTTHYDVLVVGAGISGIGAAYHLKDKCPDHTFAILEGRHDIGGTWDIFRYPGVRSDSDMHTLGYNFKPWAADKAIADGPSIMEYLRETVDEFEVDAHIRFGHLVERAEWSSDDARWTVEARVVGPDGGTTGTTGTTTFTCGYLFMCSGYYSYKGGYLPDFEGHERFEGQIVHPQEWPEDLDYAGKPVVVIGSGATAMTIIPAMAADVAHITMLQRSPTYVVSRPDVDAIANKLRDWLPDDIAYKVTRLKNTTLQQLMYKKMRDDPEKAKGQLLDLVQEALGPDYDVEAHFTPSYNPWDQRLCLIPNSDLFDAINAGQASVVTDQIKTFTETGIELESGDVLEADIIITATGLRMVTLGEAEFVVDGVPVDFSKTWTYKGFAYSDVPNLASSFGYVNASWTLRADLICEYVCRLLDHMQEVGAEQCTPRLRDSDLDMPENDFIENFSSGYMQRTMHMLPRQGDREPWTNPQKYSVDKKRFLKAPVDDGVMRFTSATAPTRAPGERVAEPALA